VGQLVRASEFQPSVGVVLWCVCARTDLTTGLPVNARLSGASVFWVAGLLRPIDSMTGMLGEARSPGLAHLASELLCIGTAAYV
jgi:hypothetical protein